MSEEAAHYHGHRERLKKRFLEAGDEALADYELLELILFRAIPRRDVKPIAKMLLQKFGSFAEVIAATLLGFLFFSLVSSVGRLLLKNWHESAVSE